MIRFLLIRHGNTDLSGRVLYGRMPGLHLNEDGRKQARALAQAIKEKYVLSEIISSPLERALETARPIAEAQNIALTIDEGIAEIDFGLWMGKSFEELRDQEDWRAYNRRRATHWPPGGESMMDVQARAWRSIQKALHRHAGRGETTLAFVTHGDVIRAVLLLLLGIPADHIQRLEISTASVTEVLAGPHDPVVRSVNQILD